MTPHEELPQRLREIAETTDDWNAPIGARVDLIEAAKELERLRAIVDKLIALRDSACEVMLLLTVHGPSIVPHLEDTDDNPGEALRRCIAETVKIDREWQATREAAEAEKGGKGELEIEQ